MQLCLFRMVLITMDKGWAAIQESLLCKRHSLNAEKCRLSNGWFPLSNNPIHIMKLGEQSKGRPGATAGGLRAPLPLRLRKTLASQQEALIRNRVGQHLDLGLPSLQKCKVNLSIKGTSSMGSCYSSLQRLRHLLLDAMSTIRSHSSEWRKGEVGSFFTGP